MTKYLISSVFSILNSLTFGQSLSDYKQLPDTLINSKFLGYEKNISINLPRFYQNTTENQKFPIIIIFDSQNKRNYNYILQSIDYLTANGQMPSSIVVGIESASEKRYEETQLKINDKEATGEYNEEFIFSELIPLIKNKFHGSDFTLLLGHSRYGYFTSYLLSQHASELNAVISLDAFLTEINVHLVDSLAKICKNNSFKHELYYRYSVGENQSYMKNFQQMEDTLNKTIICNPLFNTKGISFPEANHNAVPGLTIGLALYEIFEFWSKEQNRFHSNDNKDVKIMDDLNLKIKQHYGTELPYSLGVLNGKGWDLFNEKEFQSAIDSWQIMLDTYPGFSEGYLGILDAQIQLKRKNAYSETIARFKASLAHSDFYSEKEKEELMKEIENMVK